MHFLHFKTLTFFYISIGHFCDALCCLAGTFCTKIKKVFYQISEILCSKISQKKSCSSGGKRQSLYPLCTGFPPPKKKERKWRLYNCGNTTEATTLLQQFIKKNYFTTKMHTSRVLAGRTQEQWRAPHGLQPSNSVVLLDQTLAPVSGKNICPI